jgi:hypothetical protein
MLTRGSINLDVEDGYGPFDRPLLSEITVDMLRYSIHFPMKPMVIFFSDTILHGRSHRFKPLHDFFSFSTNRVGRGLVEYRTVILPPS